jgi:hypothetical protein
MADIFFHHRPPSKPVPEISQLWSDDSIQDDSAIDVLSDDVSTNDVSTYDVSTNDVSTYDVSTNDVSTYDDSVQDFTSYDVSMYDVSSHDVDIYDASNPDVSCFDPTMFLYIVSDLCKENLLQRLDRMSTENRDLKSIWIFAVTSIRDMASGLDYLHKQGNYLYFFEVFSHSFDSAITPIS